MDQQRYSILNKKEILLPYDQLMVLLHLAAESINVDKTIVDVSEKYCELFVEMTEEFEPVQGSPRNRTLMFAKPTEDATTWCLLCDSKLIRDVPKDAVEVPRPNQSVH
ncbi:MAG: hypothetical protein U9N57_01190 [Pseudomonadota bacterium]|nr:hypothetical protein [Pseudomonadota bacterium]